MPPQRDVTSTLDQDRLRRLIEAGRSVVAERELEGVFARLLDVARELTGARFAAIGVLDEARENLADFITAGIDPHAHSIIGDLPRGRGVLGLLISKPEPLRLADVGAHVRSYGFPPGHPAMTSFLGVPILIRGEAWGNLYLTDKDGGEFDDADEEAAVVLASWAAIAVENARLYRQTEQRRAELERSVRALEATSEIARAVGGETQLDRVLELIAKRSRALVEAAGVAILLIDGDEFIVAATAGEIPRRIVGSRVTRTGSVAGRVVSSGRAGAGQRRQRTRCGSRSATSVSRRSPGCSCRSCSAASSLGVIEAFDRHGGPEFRAEDERLLLAAAASAATAVATAQSVEQDRLRRTLRAAEEERRRWARELHDETLQGLGGLRVLLSSARRSHDVEQLHRTLDTAVDQIAQEIAQPARADHRAPAGGAGRAWPRACARGAVRARAGRFTGSSSTRTSSSPTKRGGRGAASMPTSRRPSTGSSRSRSPTPLGMPTPITSMSRWSSTTRRSAWSCATTAADSTLTSHRPGSGSPGCASGSR